MTREPSETLLIALDAALTRLAESVDTVYGQGVLEEVLGDSEEITPAQLRTLRQLGDVDSITVGGIASGLGISYPAATKAVDRLVERELAGRQRDPSDARTIRVQLSHKGRDLVARLGALRRERLRATLERLGGHPSGEALLALLEAFLEAGTARDSGFGIRDSEPQTPS